MHLNELCVHTGTTQPGIIVMPQLVGYFAFYCVKLLIGNVIVVSVCSGCDFCRAAVEVVNLYDMFGIWIVSLLY